MFGIYKKNDFLSLVDLAAHQANSCESRRCRVRGDNRPRMSLFSWTAAKTRFSGVSLCGKRHCCVSALLHFTQLQFLLNVLLLFDFI